MTMIEVEKFLGILKNEQSSRRLNRTDENNLTLAAVSRRRVARAVAAVPEPVRSLQSSRLRACRKQNVSIWRVIRD